MSRIVLVEGPGRGNLFTVGSGATIGRSRSCTVRLEGRAMSRVHARIERRGDALWLVDADSRNGVYVNGHKIKEHLLKVDDEVEIGEFVMIFDPSFDPAKGIPERKNPTVAVIHESIGDAFIGQVADTDLRAAFDRLKIVVETTALLHSLSEEKAAAKALLERLLGVVRASRGFVMLVDDQGKPTPAAKVAPDGQDDFQVSPVIVHPVARERRSVLGYDVAKQGPLEGRPISILISPLLARSRYLGFVYLDGPRDSTSFSDLDLRFAAAMAASAAAVLADIKKLPPPVESGKKGDFLDRVWKKEMSLPSLLDEIEKDCLAEALKRANGDLAKVAEMVGVTRQSLDGLLKTHGIAPDAPKGPAEWKSVEV